MGTAGHYSDRFFGPGHDDASTETLGVTADRGGRTEVVGMGADDARPISRHRWLRVVVGIAALGVAAAFLTHQDDATSDSSTDGAPATGAVQERPARGTNVASRSGVTTVPLSATTSDGVLWKSRGYSYVVRVWNGTATPLALIDVTASASGTEILWNDPVTVPARGSADLKVDFLLVNCAAATAPAPRELRLRVKAVGTDEVQVADLAVERAADAVNGAPNPRCLATDDRA
jgi:hypothetical protein